MAGGNWATRGRCAHRAGPPLEAHTRLIACLCRSACCAFPPSAAATAAAMASTARARLRALRSVIFLFSRYAQIARPMGIAKKEMA